ncbi:hypothetical protein BJX99DRAFT_252306 [Aspergillus californicus]
MLSGLGRNNESIELLQNFHQDIEKCCQDHEDGITYVQAQTELVAALFQQYEKPIYWGDFTRNHPMAAGTPSSIPEILQFLEDIRVPTVEVHDYTASEMNEAKPLGSILDHFRTLSDVSLPWNCLDIRNQSRSSVPLPIHQVDLLHRAQRWQNQSVSKAITQHSPYDHADHEFYLLSTRRSISSIHADTAGKSTYIIGLEGKKVWYLPYQPSADALQLFGSTNPKPFRNGWMRIEILPGDLLIMPPGYPHAVFTPEDSLTFGGNFYTLPHLGNSLCFLRQQSLVDSHDELILSNELITCQDYRNFTTMLQYCTGHIKSPMATGLIRSALQWGISDTYTTESQLRGNQCHESDSVQRLQADLRVALWQVLKRFN